MHDARAGAQRRADGPAYAAFVAELATVPDSARLLRRLRAGHRADEFGRCAHPSHSYRGERFPCSTVRLARLVENMLPAAQPPLRAARR